MIGLKSHIFPTCFDPDRGLLRWVRETNADSDRPDLSRPKQHSWKNAFHLFEHAPVGHLTGQQLHDQPPPPPLPLRRRRGRQHHPSYLYFGEVVKRRTEV